MLNANRKLDYENLGSFEIYLNPDDSVVIRITRVNDRYYAIPYDMFKMFSSKSYYIRHDHRVDRHFIEGALKYAGYVFKTTKHSASFQAGLLMKSIRLVNKPHQIITVK